MPDLAHAIMHLALCTSAAKTPADTPIAVHVQMMYRIGGAAIDKTFTVARGSRPDLVIEFDITRGTYELIATAPKYNCSTTDWLDFLPDHVRTFQETLDDGPPSPPEPTTLFEGDAPASFLYVKPTFVVFDGSLACGAKITTPLDVKIDAEYDPVGFYVRLEPSSAVQAGPPALLAVRLRTPTGLYHYLKLPIVFPTPWRGWPQSDILTIDENTVTSIATEKTDVLLCPKFHETSAG